MPRLLQIRRRLTIYVCVCMYVCMCVSVCGLGGRKAGYSCCGHAGEASAGCLGVLRSSDLRIKRPRGVGAVVDQKRAGGVGYLRMPLFIHSKGVFQLALWWVPAPRDFCPPPCRATNNRPCLASSEITAVTFDWWFGTAVVS